MTEIERKPKKAKQSGKIKTSTQTKRSAASSYSETSDAARRWRIFEEQNREYSAPEANRRAAMQRKTESWMDLTTEAEPEARAAIDRYKATEDAKYYAAMNQHGATIGDDAMLERGFAGYKRAAAKWREGYHKGLNSESATDETLEGAQRKQNYWAETAKQAAQFGDQARYNMAVQNVAKLQDDQYNLQMEENERQKEEYEKNLDALRQSNPAEYYALTKSDDEIDRMIAYFDYEDKNNAGRSGYGVTRTPEEEARLLRGMRQSRFIEESDADHDAAVRAEKERHDRAVAAYKNRRTVMDDTTGRTLRTVADDPHWVEYFDRTPEEQAEYLNNLRRARFVGESDAEREAYIQGEKDLYAEQLRNYQNGPDYNSNLATDMINAESNIKSLELAKSIHELERADKSPANIEAGRAALREQQGHLLTENKYYYDKKTMSHLATGAGPADSRDYQEMIDKGWVLYSDFYELPEDQQNNVYAVAATDPEKAVSLAQHYLKLAEDEHYQKIHDWVNKDSGWQFGRRALGMVGGTAAKLVSGLDPYGTMGQGMSKTGNALISGGAASASRNGLFGIEFLGGDESGISSDVPFIGKGQAGLSYQVGASVLQSVATAVPAIIAGNYSAAASKVAETIGLVLMGSSAAADDYTECIDKGMTVDQARLHATAAGVAEAAFERISLENLIHPELTTNALKRWLQQAGIEASEEVCTSLANRISDELLTDIYGVESDVDRRTRELVADGLSYNAARDKAENEWIADVIQDGMSGFLSGLIMGGGSEVIRSVANKGGKALNVVETRKEKAKTGAAVSRSDGSVEALQAYAKDNGIEIKAVETAEQNAGESAEQGEQSAAQNSYSNRDYRSISDTNSKVVQSIRSEVRGKTVQEQQTIRDSLVEKYGEGIAPVVNNAISVETAARVRQEYGSVDSIQAARNQAVSEIKDESLRQAVSDGYDSAAYALAANQGGENGMNTMSRYIQQRRNTGSGSEMSMNATVTAQDGSAKTIAITGMSEDGKRVSLADGSEVAVKDLQADEDTTSAIQQLADLDLGADATKVLEAYQQSGVSGTDGYRWMMDYATAYNQGRTRQISLEQAAQRSSLDERTVMDAYTLGQQAANRETLAGLEKLKNLPKRKGANGRTANIDTTEIKGKTMSKSELEQFELANQYAQALGVDMVWFSSREQGGKFIDKNGAYENGKIYMDIHAGRNFTADLTSGILATMGHELTHFQQQYAPEEYQALKSFLFEQIAKSSPNGEARLERLIWEKQRRSGNTLSRKAAEDEVVADACQKMLRDSKAVHDFASQQPEAASGVIRWLDKWFKRVRSIFGRGGNYSEEAQLMDSLEQDVKAAFGELWDKALKQAVQTHDEVGNIEKATTEGEIQEESKAQNSERDTEYLELAKDPEENADRLQEMVDEAAKRAGYIYRRNTRRKLSAINSARAGVRMFVEGNDELEHYGRYRYAATGAGAIRATDIMDDLLQLVTDYYEENGMDHDGITEEWVNPSDIVISAQMWDDEDFVSYAWDNYFESIYDETDKIPAIVTDDGLIVFGDDNARIKSLDPITYDDAGNVIPLSERFNEANEDIRYSERPATDSAGRELSEGQQEYFKDSKVRDGEGHLIPVYHGTKADFHVFDFTQGGVNGTQEGFGIYLTNDKRVSDSYGDRVIEGYANIKRPATSWQKTIKRGELVKLIKTTCMQEAQRMVNDGEYDSVQEALFDTWISNYVLTYESASMEPNYRKAADVILQANSNDMDIIQEVIIGQGIRSYPAAMEFYHNALIPATGIDGFWTKWKSRGQGVDADVILAFDSNQVKNVDNLNPTDNPDIRYSERDYSTPSDEELLMNAKVEDAESPEARAALQNSQKQARQIRDLTRRLERLQTEIRGYEGDSPNRISVRQFTRQALDLFGIPAGVRTEMGELLQSVAEGVLAGHNLSQNDIMYFFETLITNGREKTVADETLAEIRDDLKGRKIYVNENVKAEFGDGWNAFRKRAFSLGIQLTNNEKNMGIDSVNAELAELYPGKFDANETDLRSILENIVDTAESGKTSDVPILDAMREVQKQTGEPVREQLQTMLDQFTRQIEIMQDQAAVERKARAGNAAEIAKARKQINEAKEALREVRKQRNAWKRKSEGADARQKRALDAALRGIVQHDAKQIAEAVRQKQALAKKLQDQIDRENKILSGKLRAPELVKLLKAEREKAEARVKKQKEQVFQNYKERKKATDLRGRISALKKDLQKSLLHPTDTNYVPAGLAKSIVDALDALDTSPKEGTKSAARYAAISDKLRAVAVAYNDMHTDNEVGYEYTVEYDQELAKLISDLAKTMEGRNARDLSADELKTVYDYLRSIRDTMVEARKLLSNLRYESVREAIASGLEQQYKITPINDVSKMERKKRLSVMNKRSPMRAVEYMSNMDRGAALYEAFQQVEAGDEQRLAWSLAYQNDFRELKSGKNEKTYWQSLTKQIDYGATDKKTGKTVTMTKMQAIQIFMTAQREAANKNLEHFFKGGATIRNAKDIMEGKGNIRSNEVFVTPELLKNIENSFTEWDRQYMSRMRDYLKREGKAVNNVFYNLKHRVLALEENYVPTIVDQKYLDAKLETTDFSGLFVKSPRSTQAITKGAPQPLIIDGMETMMNKHVQEQAQYIGMAAAIRDFAKIFNGKVSTNDNGVGYTSLKAEIERNFGKEGVHLITQALIDIQGGSTQSGWRSGLEDFLKKLQTSFVRHALLFNLSVTIKQAASYVAAGSIISREALLKGNRSILNKNEASHSASLITQIFLNPNGKTAQKIFARADKYTALHADRRNGMNFAEIELGQKNYGKLRQKAAEIGANLEQKKGGHKVREIGAALNPASWIQRMDVATTAALFVACEYQARMDGLEGEAYHAKVKELYERVLRETQPMYDSLHRTAQQKSGGSLAQYLFPFRTVPIQNHGQMASAYDRLLAAKTKSNTEKAEAAKFFRKTLIAQIESAVVFSAMTFAAALTKRKTKKYRDEDGELTLESVARGFGLDVASTLVSVASPMWGSELWSLSDRFINKFTGKGGYTYDSFSVGALDMINDTAAAIDKIAADVGKATRREDVSLKEFGTHMFSLLTKLGNLSGIPADTIKTYTEGFIGNIQDAIDGRIPALNDESWERDAATNARRYMKAIQAGDTEKAETVMEEMRENYKEEKPGLSEKAITRKIRNALTSYIKEQFTSKQISEDEAISYLVDYAGKKENDAFWQIREWEAKKAHKGEAEYTFSPYEHLRELIDNGKDLTSEIAYLQEHGKTASAINSDIKKYIRQQFDGGELNEQEAMKMLQKYHKVKDDRTGKYRNDTEDEAWFILDEWKAGIESEDDEEFSYEKYRKLYSAMDNDDDASAAWEEMSEHGVSDDTLKKAVSAHLQKQFQAGEISEDVAIDRLQSYRGMDEDEAYWQVDKWKSSDAAYKAGEDFNESNYRDLYAAIDGNKDPAAAMKELTSHGYKESDVYTQAKKYLSEKLEKGEITEQAFKNKLSRYCKIVKADEVDDAVQSVKNSVRYKKLMESKPNLDATESQVNAWYDGTANTRNNGHESAKTAGMSIENYIKAKTILADVKDANGNRTGEDEYIAALTKITWLTPRQKDALYYERYKGTTKYSHKTW